MSFTELLTNLFLLNKTEQVSLDSLYAINSSSLAYCRNVSLRGTAVADYKTSRFKVSDLKWPDLPVWGTEKNKSDWWGSNLCKSVTPFWQHIKDFMLQCSVFILERTSSSIWMKSCGCYCQLTSSYSLVGDILTREHSSSIFHLRPLKCPFLFLATKPSEALFLLSKPQPLSAKPGRIVLL